MKQTIKISLLVVSSFIVGIIILYLLLRLVAYYDYKKQDYDTYYKRDAAQYSETLKTTTPFILNVKNGDKEKYLDFRRPFPRYKIPTIILDGKIARIAINAKVKTEGAKGEVGFDVECQNYKCIYKDQYELYGRLEMMRNYKIISSTPVTELSMDFDIPLVTEEIIIYSGSKGSKSELDNVSFDDIEIKAIAIYEKKK